MKGYLLPREGRRREKVRIQKEINQARGTHSLEMAEGGTKSGHGKKVTEQGALTSWRQQREGQVRTWKESNQARGTHQLETAERQVRT